MRSKNQISAVVLCWLRNQLWFSGNDISR